jgi:orotate phosphoribosyltransferase
MTENALAEKTARILLDTRSVYVRTDGEPYFFSSGWASPVFVDCKRLISFPLARRTLIELAIEKILATAGYAGFDAIAGGELAGVPFAAMIADRLHLPLVIVRKQAKGFGPSAQIEGEITAGARVLLVEDLTTDGRTKAAFCTALMRAGAQVEHAFVVFKYGIFDRVVRDLDSLGVGLFSLAMLGDVLAHPLASARFSAEQRAELTRFADDPADWSRRHGGIAKVGG